MTVKFYLTALLYVAAAALFIGAAPSASVKYTSRNTIIGIGYFQNCTLEGLDKNCKDSVSRCPDLNDMFRTGQAFAIINSTLVGVLALLLIARAASPDMCLSLWPIFVFGGLLCIGSGLIEWGVSFAIYQNDFCGVAYKNDPSIKIGAAGPLCFVAWCLIIISTLVELCVASVAPIEADENDTAPDAVVADEKKATA